MDIDWNKQLTDQLDWHWTTALRPRFDGITDEEYFWEPVSGMWNLRPRAEARTAMAAGAGELRLDYEHPEPKPVPATTIAWRLAHIIVGVFAGRVAGHFGGPPADYENWVYADTATGALQQLDEQYAAWKAGVQALGEEGLSLPCGPAEGPMQTTPRPCWSCTSTAKRSTTAPRSRCCATSTHTGPIETGGWWGHEGRMDGQERSFRASSMARWNVGYA